MADFGLAAQIGRGNAMPGAQQQDPQNRMMQMMQLQQLQQNMMLAREQNAREAALAPLREGQIKASTQGDQARTQVAQESRDMARLQREELQRQQRINRGLISVMGMVDEGKLDLSTPAGFNQIPEVDVRMAARGHMAQTRKLLSEAEKAGMEADGVKRAITYEMLDRAGDGISGPREFNIYRNKILKVEPDAAAFLPDYFNPDTAQQLRDFVGTRKRTTELIGGVPTVGLEGSPNRREVGVTPFRQAGVAPPPNSRDTISLPAGVQPPTRAQIGSTALTEPALGANADAETFNAARAAGAVTPPYTPPGAMPSGVPGQRLPVAGDANFASAATPTRGPIPASQFVADRQAAPKPLTIQQERQLRNEIAKDFKSVDATIAQMNDVISATKDVAELPENTKKWITGWTGFIPSYQNETREGDRRWRNLEGKITNLGKQAASLSGAIGSMAVQEWKIVKDMIASTDITNLTVEGLNRQIDLIESQARGATNRVRDAYERQYQEEFGRFGDRFKLPPPSEPSAASAGKGSGKGDVDTSNPLLGGKRQ
jgi:hypothetical protein